MYKFPKSGAHLKRNRFEFELPDGTTHSVPLMDYFPVGADRWAREEGVSLTNAEFVIGLVTFIDAELGAKFAALFDDESFTRDQLADFHVTWQKAGRVSMGESSASQDS